MKNAPPTIYQQNLSRPQAAAFLGVSVPTMARWASESMGPAYYIMGNRARYLQSDLESYYERHRKSTFDMD